MTTPGARENKKALDKNDPNWDSDEERTVVLRQEQQQLKSELQVYKEKVRATQGGVHWVHCGGDQWRCVECRVKLS